MIEAYHVTKNIGAILSEGFKVKYIAHDELQKYILNLLPKNPMYISKSPWLQPDFGCTLIKLNIDGLKLYPDYFWIYEACNVKGSVYYNDKLPDGLDFKTGMITIHTMPIIFDNDARSKIEKLNGFDKLDRSERREWYVKGVPFKFPLSLITGQNTFNSYYGPYSDSTGPAIIDGDKFTKSRILGIYRINETRNDLMDVDKINLWDPKKLELIPGVKIVPADSRYFSGGTKLIYNFNNFSSRIQKLFI